MDDTDFRAISSSLKNSVLESKDDRLPATISEETSSTYNEGEIDGLLRALHSLSIIRSSSEVPPREFIQDVKDAFSEMSPKTPKNDLDRFADRVQILLETDHFAVAGKASSLILSDEKVYCKARIVTDLRPIFHDDFQDGPEMMIVVHSLKLTFHQGTRDHQIFHLAMDANDITELRKVLDRAESKAKLLKERIPQYPFWE
jgi:hypothetical protein